MISYGTCCPGMCDLFIDLLSRNVWSLKGLALKQRVKEGIYYLFKVGFSIHVFDIS